MRKRARSAPRRGKLAEVPEPPEVAVLRALVRGDAATARAGGLALAEQVLRRPEVRLALQVVEGGPFLNARIIDLCDSLLAPSTEATPSLKDGAGGTLHRLPVKSHLTEQERAALEELRPAVLRGRPVGPPLTEEERAALDEGRRSLAAGERGFTTEQVVEMIAERARSEGATDAEIQEILSIPSQSSARRRPAVDG